MRSDLPPDSLSGMKYTVFGLGDSSYSKFNVASIKLYKRVGDLGAESILARGTGDDQHRLGLYGGLLPWMDELTQTLLVLFPPTQSPISHDVLLPQRYELVYGQATDQGETFTPSSTNYSDANPFYASLAVNKQLTDPDTTLPYHEQRDVRHLEFDITGSGIQ